MLAADNSSVTKVYINLEQLGLMGAGRIILAVLFKELLQIVYTRFDPHLNILISLFLIAFDLV